MSDKSNLPTVLSRITEYLDSGGLWNPELADHAAVRDLICDARAEINRLREELDAARRDHGIVMAALQSSMQDCEHHKKSFAEAVAAHVRAERILAALREPSEAMVADAAEYVLGYHEPDYRDIRTAIVAAVAAAEQEVGHA